VPSVSGVISTRRLLSGECGDYWHPADFQDSFEIQMLRAECSEDLVNQNAKDKICLNKCGRGICILGKDYEKKNE